MFVWFGIRVAFKKLTIFLLNCPPTFIRFSSNNLLYTIFFLHSSLFIDKSGSPHSFRFRLLSSSGEALLVFLISLEFHLAKFVLVQACIDYLIVKFGSFVRTD